MSSTYSSSPSLFSSSTSDNSNASTSASSIRSPSPDFLNQNHSSSSSSSINKSHIVNLPLKLPKGPSVESINLERLILDSEFQGVPVGFLIAKLRSMGKFL